MGHLRTTTQSCAKRTRRINTHAAAHDATDETPTATAAAALTGLKDPFHLLSADADPSLIVDYNESTPSSRFQLALRQHRLRMLSRRLCPRAQRQMIMALPLKVQVLPLVGSFTMVLTTRNLSQRLHCRHGNVRSQFHMPIVFHVAM